MERSGGGVMEGGRAARHQRSSKTRWLVIGVVGVAALVLVWFFARQAPVAKRVGSRAPEKSKPAAVGKDTYVVLVVAGGTQDSTLTAAALLVSREGSSSKVGLAVSGRAFLNVPGRGPEPLADAYEEGPANVVATLVKLSGVKVKGYVVVDQAIYTRATGDNELTLLFDRSLASDLDSGDLQSAADGFENVNNSIVEIDEVPGRSTRIGSQIYYQLDQLSFAGKVKSIWGIAAPGDSGAARVIVLNGSGLPGAGTKAADVLMAAGLSIVDVRNADNFDYQKTLIYVYGSTSGRAAKEAAKVLKVGEIVGKQTPQDITDLVVIVGADFDR